MIKTKFTILKDFRGVLTVKHAARLTPRARVQVHFGSRMITWTGSGSFLMKRERRDQSSGKRKSKIHFGLCIRRFFDHPELHSDPSSSWECEYERGKEKKGYSHSFIVVHQKSSLSPSPSNNPRSLGSGTSLLPDQAFAPCL